jgi:predicted TIM-barrel enzyme
LGIDPGTAAMIGGIIGAAVQWIMQNASQANGFFFGSSPSSRKANEDLVRSITESSKKLK